MDKEKLIKSLLFKLDEITDLTNKFRDEIEVLRKEEPKEEPKEDVILVPDNIKIIKIADRFGIVFNDCKQILIKSVRDNVYIVAYNNSESFIKCKLVKTDIEDLKAGDLAFRTDYNNEFSSINLYCIVLNEEEYAFIAFDKDIMRAGNYFYHWYKVVPLN